ncbi:MAG: DUF2232 domain-containing protein [Candidatus Wallbacteria bacterium]|nr:DUF2232 domain-containing protein [Candidatus Wallbacteria bacterium]
MPEQVTGAKKIALSGMMAALATLLYLLSTVPLINIIGVLLCPVPLTWVGYCYGFKLVFLASCVSTLVTGLLLGPVQAYFFFSLFATVAVVTGFALHRNISPSKILLSGTLVMMVLNIFFYYGVEKTLGLEDFLADGSRTINSGLAKVVEMVPDSQFSPAQKTRLIAYYSLVLERLIRFPLSIFTMVSFANIYINHFACSLVFLRLGRPIPMLEPIFLWKAPSWMLLPYLSAIAAGQHSLFSGSSFNASVVFNVVVLMETMYFFIGFGMITFFFFRFRVHWLLRLIALPILFVYGRFVMILGIIDSLLNFRELPLKKAVVETTGKKRLR